MLLSNRGSFRPETSGAYTLRRRGRRRPKSGSAIGACAVARLAGSGGPIGDYYGSANRRKLIYSQYRDSLGEIFRNLCRYKGVEIIEGHLMPDHVHVLLAIPPKYSVASVMGYLKGKSSLMIFDRHANLKYKFGNRKFWAEGYYVSTVGLNEATIAKYIRGQESHDIALDKLSVKEYEDPFKRG